MAVIAALKTNEKDDILIFCPSDHYIENVEGYLQSLMIGLGEISDKEIFTLGIKPSFPSTAFGYVEVAPQSEKKKYSLSSKTVYRKTEFRCSNKNYCRKKCFLECRKFYDECQHSDSGA